MEQQGYVIWLGDVNDIKTKQINEYIGKLHAIMNEKLRSRDGLLEKFINANTLDAFLKKLWSRY